MVEDVVFPGEGGGGAVDDLGAGVVVRVADGEGCVGVVGGPCLV